MCVHACKYQIIQAAKVWGKRGRLKERMSKEYEEDMSKFDTKLKLILYYWQYLYTVVEVGMIKLK